MKSTIEMANKKISKLLLQFSLPAIIGMLVGALYNIISRIFVGKGVGTQAIAAITVAFPMQILIMASSMLVAIGATALISIRLGEKKIEEAHKYTSNGTSLCILFPFALTVIYFSFADPILILFGASAEVLPLARDYTDLIMLGSVPNSIAFGMNNFIRAEGSPRTAMFTQLIAALLNILLHYAFIFDFGMGIKGAGWATIISQSVAALFVLGHFMSKRSLLKIKLKYLWPQAQITRGILAIGLAPFSMQIANTIQQTLLNQILKSYGGDLAISAIGIVMAVASLIFMPILGIGQGAQPIIGFNYGARNFQRVKETLKIAIIAGTVLGLIGFVCTFFGAEFIASLFSNNDIALTEMTSHAMRRFFALIPLIGFNVVSSTYFQATGKPIQATILGLARQVLAFIPLLLILPRFYGIEGVWVTAPIADALSVILTFALISNEMKKLSNTRTPSEEIEAS